MKIINADYHTGWGGTEAMVMNYALALESKADVINIVPPNSVLFNRMSQKGLQVRTFSKPKFLLHPKTIKEITTVMREVSPDAVISHNKMTSLNIKAAQKLMGDKTPLIQVGHSGGLIYSQKITDRFILVSRGIETAAEKRGFKQDSTIVVENFSDLAPVQTRYEETRKPRQYPVLGYLGRFSSKKGVHSFLSLISTLQGEGINARGVMAGGKGKRLKRTKAEVERLSLHSNIEINGWIDDKEKFFNEIDILIVPSLRESFCLSVIEAWRFGVPVVSTKTAGPSSIIEHQKTGMLCDFSSASMAQNVKDLWGHPELYESIRANAHDAFPAYSLTAQKSEELYQAIQKLTR